MQTVTRKGWEFDVELVQKIPHDLNDFVCKIYIVAVVGMSMLAFYWLADTQGNTCDCLQHFKCVVLLSFEVRVYQDIAKSCSKQWVWHLGNKWSIPDLFLNVFFNSL